MFLFYKWPIVEEMEQLWLPVDAKGVKLNKWFDGVSERVEKLMREIVCSLCLTSFYVWVCEGVS